MVVSKPEANVGVLTCIYTMLQVYHVVVVDSYPRLPVSRKRKILLGVASAVLEETVVEVEGC